MSVTITAVADPVASASNVTTERTLQDFVVTLQANAASGMPQLANPAAIASELSGFLRGYVERAKMAERSMSSAAVVNGDTAPDFVQTAAMDESRPDLHGGPARERLEPLGANSPVLSPSARASLAQLERVHELMVAQMETLIEGTVLTSGTSQFVRSLDTLLRGQ